ncbi:MAG: hypothetical protein M3442_10435, partial [Chloroflexota bacterium]|nr:hypothetical protein [Chloroflexota bacterium]
RAGAEYAVEITRFGPTKGMKADVWDEQEGTVEQGVVFGTMSSDGKVADALWRAISDKLETKARQLPPVGARGVLWMSLGRSYIGAGEFEPPGAGLQAMMRRTTLQALATALNDMRGVGLGGRVSHLVLRLKGKSEHVYPPFPEE